LFFFWWMVVFVVWFWGVSGWMFLRFGFWE